MKKTEKRAKLKATECNPQQSLIVKNNHRLLLKKTESGKEGIFLVSLADIRHMDENGSLRQ